ncbi:MAG: icmP [Francisellaceae bacterium]|nr:icmP [Francisellaceae bacterium]
MSSQQSPGQNNDNANNMLWIIALIIGLGAIIWYSLSVKIKLAVIYIKALEVKIIYYLFNLLHIDNELNVVVDVLDKLKIIPDSLDADLFTQVSEIIGDYYKYPICILLLFLGLKFWLNDIQTRFKNKYDMNRLRQNQEDLWPQIQPVTKLDLVTQNLDEGPWAMAMTPIQYCKKYHLVKIEIIKPNELVFSKEVKFKISLLKDRAEKILSAQLGRLWQGVGKLPMHRLAILAVFIARGCRDTKAATDIVAQLSSSAASGKMNYEGVEALCNKHIQNDRVQTLFNNHAYELTVMASMLLFAREDGVVASADFLWVKPIDRKLWYVLNTIGRQTHFVEVGGIMSHWMTESSLRRALRVPQIHEALKALELALTEMIYTPDEEERKQFSQSMET